jgi:HK97 family phage prohead protease
MEQKELKFALTPKVKNINVEDRTVKFVGTRETKDRTGDVIEVNGWELDNFNKNPVFLWDHNSSIPPIGKVLSVIKENMSLVFTVQFASKNVSEFADSIFESFKEGFLNAVSVGFLPKEFDLIRNAETDEITGFRFTRQELLELSAVSIPAHQDALAFGGDKQLQEAYQRLQEEAKAHPAKKSLMDVEDFHKLKLEELQQDGDEAVMKEQLEALEAKVKELKSQVESLVTLKEAVDLSKSVTDSFNKSVVALLKTKDSQAPAQEKSVGESVPQEPQGSTFDASKLVSVLEGLSSKLNEKSFKPKGE